MNKIKFSHIISFTIIFFLILSYTFYQKTQDIAMQNAYNKIDELLLNYKAFRTYISKVQKKEVYRLQELGYINKEYFNPTLLSSSYGARNVNHYYNQFRADNNQKPIIIKFSSNNPRNPINQANKEESEILNRFNNNEIKKFSKVSIDKNGDKILFYAIPTKRTTKKCMRCHSTPEIAPKGLLKIYGDKNGFHEEEGKIRAILSTTYPIGEDIKNAQNTFILLTFITFVIFTILLTIIYHFIKRIEESNINLDKTVQRRTEELKKEKEHLRTILDVNPSIIIVTNSNGLISANKQFLHLFNYDLIEQFTSHSNCICEYFITFDDKEFPSNKIIDGIIWYKYLIRNHNITHTVSVKIEEKLYSFIISGVILDNKNNDVLITLQNITEQKKKEKLLFEQSKMASMGEMIGNIAHQWRQPLSLISTASTGMQLKSECNILEDDELHKTCSLINTNAQYLSQTIDDFKNFIKGDREKEIFNLSKEIESFLHIIEGSKVDHAIDIILDIDKSIEINGYKNELTQCLINLFNNSKDALENSSKKLIFISAIPKDDTIILAFKDNAGGIAPEILGKIFEPYFTTKHKSQGTGLGLHMTYNLITDGMGGSIIASNIDFMYKNDMYSGACFTITLV